MLDSVSKSVRYFSPFVKVNPQLGLSGVSVCVFPSEHMHSGGKARDSLGPRPFGEMNQLCVKVTFILGLVCQSIWKEGFFFPSPFKCLAASH